jgi:MFS family permease
VSLWQILIFCDYIFFNSGCTCYCNEVFMFKGITGNVLILGLVSFLTDVSSEMIYPLLPLFLTGVLGAGPAFLGVIEGVAESTAALLKLVSGIWSDRVRRRKPLVLAGYGLSSLVRPLVAVATGPLAVLVIRFADRIGKGVRTSPRDALIADSVDPGLRGRAFGFHRSMDHAGALVGPLWRPPCSPPGCATCGSSSRWRRSPGFWRCC